MSLDRIWPVERIVEKRGEGEMEELGKVFGFINQLFEYFGERRLMEIVDEWGKNRETKRKNYNFEYL